MAYLDKPDGRPLGREVQDEHIHGIRRSAR
nr:MAG TPA: hypothetical protein [Caudoviricetes sp.]